MSLYNDQTAGQSMPSTSSPPKRNYPSPPPLGTSMSTPYPPTATHPSYAAVVQRRPDRPAPNQPPAVQSASRRNKAKELSVPAGPKPVHIPVNQTWHSQQRTQQGTRTYAQALQARQGLQAGAIDSLRALEMGGYNISIPSSGQHNAFAQAANPAANQQINDFGLSSNPNYRPDFTETFNSVGNWLQVPRAAEDRIRPQLEIPWTAQAANDSRNRSLTTSSQSPSTISRTSRRTRDQMRTGDHEHRCGRCDAGFDTAAELNHHIRYHQEHDARPYPCRSCSARFIFKKDRRRHELVHDDNAPKYYCPHPTCKYHQQGFGRHDHLARHLSTQHRVDSVMQSSGPSSQYGR